MSFPGELNLSPSLYLLVLVLVLVKFGRSYARTPLCRSLLSSLNMSSSTSKTEMTASVQENKSKHTNSIFAEGASTWTRCSTVTLSNEGIIFIFIVFDICLSVCRFAKGNVCPKSCTLFCLVQIKKRSFLTSCVFSLPKTVLGRKLQQQRGGGGYNRTCCSEKLVVSSFFFLIHVSLLRCYHSYQDNLRPGNLPPGPPRPQIIPPRLLPLRGIPT